jgi:hypothetical protein
VASVCPYGAPVGNRGWKGRSPRALPRTLVLAVLVLCARAEAEDLSLLAGVTDTSDHTSGTYAWGLEYRQQLLPHFDASFGYLNEGHLPNDHRDGAMGPDPTRISIRVTTSTIRAIATITALRGL